MATPNSNVIIPIELKKRMKELFPYSSFTQTVIRALVELEKREEAEKNA